MRVTNMRAAKMSERRKNLLASLGSTLIIGVTTYAIWLGCGGAAPSKVATPPAPEAAGAEGGMAVAGAPTPAIQPPAPTAGAGAGDEEDGTPWTTITVRPGLPP